MLNVTRNKLDTGGALCSVVVEEARRMKIRRWWRGGKEANPGRISATGSSSSQPLSWTGDRAEMATATITFRLTAAAPMTISTSASINSSISRTAVRSLRSKMLPPGAGRLHPPSLETTKSRPSPPMPTPPLSPLAIAKLRLPDFRRRRITSVRLRRRLQRGSHRWFVGADIRTRRC